VEAAPASLVVVAAALFGATVGSFLNVCIYRMPRRGMTISSPRRSHCPGCGFALPWHDNIPLWSWISLGGQCRSCRAPISPRYLIVEALTATAFVLLVRRYLLDGPPQPLVFGAVLLLVAGCIVASFIDQDLQFLPDEVTVRGMLAILPAAVLIPDLHLPARGWVADGLAFLIPFLDRARAVLPAFLRDKWAVSAAAAALAAIPVCGWTYLSYWRWAHPKEPKGIAGGALASTIGCAVFGSAAAMISKPELALHPRIHSLWCALVGMAAGAGVILAVGAIGRQVFRKEAMGFGDVKLMGLLGGFAGWGGVLSGFALACILGSAVGIYRLIRHRSRYLPFGPYLVLGCLFTILWPAAFTKMLGWYMGLFR